MLKGIKIRLYPNHRQVNQLSQMFGNARFIWNTMLAMAKDRYTNNPSSQFVGEYGMNYLLKPVKNDYPFLKESDATSLQVSNHNLTQAFKMLFKHKGGYPRFKSRNTAKQSYTGKHPNCKVLQGKRKLKLPKLGLIKSSKTNQLKNVKIKRYTVILDPTGKYYVSFIVETEVKPLAKNGKSIGIDLGVSDLAITSDGKKYSTFNEKWLEQQVKHWQSKYDKRLNIAKIAVRQFNHNHKLAKEDITDYNNWQRAKKVKSLYQEKIRNKRTDYLQKVTTKLVKQYDTIVIEDLKAKNLLKNHKLAKSISNASWRMFRTMLEYKCQWYGKRLIIVNPKNTSRICSNCGSNTGEKPLNIRSWTCPYCGVNHDRDINAAVNILNRGLKAIG